MAACLEVRYDTARAAYDDLRGAGRRAPKLAPCGECRGWHLTPRRLTRAQWVARRRPYDALAGRPAPAAP